MIALNDEIKEAIARSMPAMAAEELRKFIEQAQQTETKLARATEQLNEANARNVELSERLSKHREIDARESAVAKQEEQAWEFQKALETREAKLIGVEAIAELKGVKDTVNLFLRNVTVHNSVVGNVPVPVGATPPGTGGYGSGSPAFVATAPLSTVSSVTESLASDPTDRKS